MFLRVVLSTTLFADVCCPYKVSDIDNKRASYVDSCLLNAFKLSVIFKVSNNFVNVVV